MANPKSLVRTSVPKNGATGEKIRHTGIYICIKHNNIQLSFSKGDVFPACPNSVHDTTWFFAGNKMKGGLSK